MRPRAFSFAYSDATRNHINLNGRVWAHSTGRITQIHITCAKLNSREPLIATIG